MSHSQTRHKAQDADSVVQAVQDGAQSVVDAGAAIYNTAIDRTRDANRQVTGYVRQNPWNSLGMAAAAGFVLGFLYGRK